MLLKHEFHSEEPAPLADTFSIVDEKTEKPECRCSILISNQPNLYPRRPVRILLNAEGSPVPASLVGACLAEAKMYCQKVPAPARIFMSVLPENTELLNLLKELGFVDNDGKVRMACSSYPSIRNSNPNAVVIDDHLEDPLEREYFLNRYNDFFGYSRNMTWVNDTFCNRDGFWRKLLINQRGMIGECIYCSRDGHGEILWLYVVPHYRQNGYGRQLLSLTLQAMMNLDGCTEVTADIDVRLGCILHVLEQTGFYQKQLLMHYPGIDVK